MSWVSIPENGRAPTARVSHSFTFVDHAFFVFGGFDNHTVLNDLYCFETVRNSWKRLKPSGPMPPARKQHTAVSFRRKLFIFGGKNEKGQLLDDLWVYHMDANRWERPAVQGRAPSARCNHAAEAIDNQMFVFGGHVGNGVAVNDTHIFNMLSMAWEPTPRVYGTPPVARWCHTLTSFADRLYVFGGFASGNKFYNEIVYLDTTKMEWRQPQINSAHPIGIAQHTAVAMEDKMAVFGGRNSTGAFTNNLLLFDVVKKVWETVPPQGSAPAARVQHAADVLGRKLYVHGGWNNQGLFSAVASVDLTDAVPPSVRPPRRKAATQPLPHITPGSPSAPGARPRKASDPPGYRPAGPGGAGGGGGASPVRDQVEVERMRREMERMKMQIEREKRMRETAEAKLKQVRNTPTGGAGPSTGDYVINYTDLVLKQPPLGEGSFGVVHKGSWRGTLVAVKKIKIAAVSTPEVLEDFKKECEVLNMLRHPNIVLYMGACVTPPNLCIVTEFCAGGSLFDIVHDRRKYPDAVFTWERRLQILKDIVKSLIYLHERNPPILHRDLKSLNVLLDDNWNAKLCDFGLARVKQLHQVAQTMCGTPSYMAPEVLDSDKSYGKTADVYSFGVMLWEVATRMQPFGGSNPMQVMRAILTGKRPEPMPRDEPRGVVSLIADCWNQDPRRRPDFSRVLVRLRELESRMPRGGLGGGAGGAGGFGHRYY